VLLQPLGHLSAKGARSFTGTRASAANGASGGRDNPGAAPPSSIAAAVPEEPELVGRTQRGRKRRDVEQGESRGLVALGLLDFRAWLYGGIFRRFIASGQRGGNDAMPPARSPARPSAIRGGNDYLEAKKATANTTRGIEFDRERLEIVKRHLGDVKLSAVRESHHLTSHGRREYRGPCARRPPGAPTSRERPTAWE
jgi:hypothetical protein